MMIFDCRSVRKCRSGAFDMEINHPKLGWIPFTATADDPEDHGRIIYAAIIRGDFGEIAEADPAPAPAPRPKSEIEELRDLVEILAEAMPNKTPQITEALARISSRKSAIER